MIVLFTFLLVGCTPPSYDRKTDSNPNYYTDYLEDYGLVDIELVSGNITDETLDLAYKIFGVDETTDSFFIYHYIGKNSEGNIIHALMPDRLGETNLLFEDYLPSFHTLNTIVTPFNDSTISFPINIGDSSASTFDIVLFEEYLSNQFADQFYTARSINGTHLNIDQQSIESFILDNLSSPIVYKVGRYYDYSSYVKSVYLGINIDGDFVFILEDHSTARVEIIYTYNTSG